MNARDHSFLQAKQTSRNAFALVRLDEIKIAAGVFNYESVRVGFMEFALEGVVIKKAKIDTAASFFAHC